MAKDGTEKTGVLKAVSDWWTGARAKRQLQDRADAIFDQGMLGWDEWVFAFTSMGTSCMKIVEYLSNAEVGGKKLCDEKGVRLNEEAIDELPEVVRESIRSAFGLRYYYFQLSTTREFLLAMYDKDESLLEMYNKIESGEADHLLSIIQQLEREGISIEKCESPHKKELYAARKVMHLKENGVDFGMLNAPTNEKLLYFESLCNKFYAEAEEHLKLLDAQILVEGNEVINKYADVYIKQIDAIIEAGRQKGEDVSGYEKEKKVLLEKMKSGKLSHLEIVNLYLGSQKKPQQPISEQIKGVRETQEKLREKGGLSYYLASNLGGRSYRRARMWNQVKAFFKRINPFGGKAPKIPKEFANANNASNTQGSSVANESIQTAPKASITPSTLSVGSSDIPPPPNTPPPPNRAPPAPPSTESGLDEEEVPPPPPFPPPERAQRRTMLAQRRVIFDPKKELNAGLSERGIQVLQRRVGSFSGDAVSSQHRVRVTDPGTMEMKALEGALKRSKIPYTAKGGDIEFDSESFNEKSVTKFFKRYDRRIVKLQQGVTKSRENIPKRSK